MKFIPYLLASFLLIPLSVDAETIYLKDGSTIVGQIKSIGEHDVVISTSIGERTIESERILRVGEAANANQFTEKQAESSSALTPNKANRAEEFPMKTYADWRMQQRNGFGFGPGIGSMLGVIGFYDHNISGQSQLHVQLDANASSRSTILGEQLLKVSRGMIFTTYRYFPSENSGFYLGAGGGYADSTLEYKSPSLNATPYKYTSNLSGEFLLGEVGWQGNDGYYFHIGIQPAVYIFSKDNYDVNQIPNTSNHRDAANQEHQNLVGLSQLSIGFGWFF